MVEDGGGKFTIHPTTGVIATATTLDRELQDSYRLVVMATDGGSLALSSSAEVMVVLEDDNDNVPEFQQEEYTSYMRDPTNSGACQ